MKNILVPVDFSEATAATVSAALDIASQCHAEVILLHVMPPPVDYIGYPGSDEKSWQLTQDQTRRSLNKLLAEAYTRQVVASCKLMRGEPVSTILEVARDSYVDLIVMGSHGHSAFYDLLIGSTSSGVMKASFCPVTIVPHTVSALGIRPLQAAS